MTRTTIILLLMAALLCATSSAQERQRDLSNYKDGGNHDLVDMYLPQGQRQMADVRAFFWGMWSQRIKAFIAFTEYTKEGYAVYSRVFIEPNSDGKWLSAWETMYSQCPYTSKSECDDYRKTVFKATYDVIERIEIPEVVKTPEGYRRFRVPIREDEARDALTYRIVFASSATEHSFEF